MKPSFKLTTTILVCLLAGSLASAQSPTIIQSTRNTMNAVHDNQAAASNAALGLQHIAPAAAPTPAARSSAAGAAPSAMKVVRSKTSKAKSTVAIHKEAAPKAATAAPKTTAPVPGTVASSSAPASENDAEDPAASEKKYNPNGRRDPFLSPVVNHGASGSGCSTGKKCLEIGTISLQGIVRSDTGFIAVVSNGLNKAYFLRENDPVFNGYVVKITGDSIVFQETMQDRLGKTFTREVVKKITTPAV